MSAGNHYLVTGGCRSGKSSYAQTMAEQYERPFYIATGWAGDDEMQKRIKKHQDDRGEEWTTVEEQIDLAGAISSAVGKGADVVLIDCLTLWTSNLMFDENADMDKAVAALESTITSCSTPLIFVTNEVGMGIVPGDAISREFRDNAGFNNQKVAKLVDNVVLTVSGIPVKIK